MLYHRGAVKTKENQQPIAPEVLEQEAARGFKRRGAFRQKLRHFTDGMALGSEIAIRALLGKLRAAGKIQRRKHPARQATPSAFSLREQRKHFVHPES